MGVAYAIPTLPVGTAVAAIDWTTIPAAAVDTYRWCQGYAPAVTARMVYIQNEGFVLRMDCTERAPKADCTDYMQPVYLDSCMEFFADWLGDGRYINMEMNARGTLLSCIGQDRHERTPITAYTDGIIFPVTAVIEAETWSVTAEIPLALLAAILGVERLTVEPGFSFRGNFYKCGDETAIPHFGMWSPIDTPEADFHKPEYFGALTVV